MVTQKGAVIKNLDKKNAHRSEHLEKGVLES